MVHLDWKRIITALFMGVEVGRRRCILFIRKKKSRYFTGYVITRALRFVVSALNTF